MVCDPCKKKRDEQWVSKETLTGLLSKQDMKIADLNTQISSCQKQGSQILALLKAGSGNLAPSASLGAPPDSSVLYDPRWRRTTNHLSLCLGPSCWMSYRHVY